MKCVGIYFIIAVILQVAVVVLSGRSPGDLFYMLYEPWMSFGEYIAPSGAAGHAMPVGAILGLLFGVLLYALLPALAICYFKRRFTAEHSASR